MTQAQASLAEAGFFTPRNVCLIGASDKSAWSGIVFSRFAMWGHEGNLYAVNRQGILAHGLPGFTSCRDIPDRIDMAYVYVPAAGVADALRDAASAGIRNAVVLTSGFSEAGAEGTALQDEVVAVVRESGMRLLGPNSLGFANVTGKSVTTSIGARLPVHPGRLGMVSQSGAIAQEINSFAHGLGIGFGIIAATGNEADISMADVVDYLVDDPATGAILLYVESIKHPDRFLAAAARAYAAKKPIVMLKLGRSPISAAVAAAHTGSLVGDDGVFDAMCRRYGIARVASIEELVITGALLEQTGPIDPPRVGMISISGGACAVYADLASASGLEAPPFAPETCAALREVLPSFASTLNPLDVTGVVVSQPELWLKVIPIVASDPGIGLVVTTTVVPNSAIEVEGMRWDIDGILAGYRAAGTKAVLAGVTLQPMGPERAAYFAEAGVECFVPDLDIGVRALAHLQTWSERLLGDPPLPTPGEQAATARPNGERETLDYLAGKGVPVIPARLATTPAAALRAAAEIGGKVVLKIASPDIAHKTEAGGVRLDVPADRAEAVFEEIVASARAHAPGAQIEGVLVSPMRAPATELIVGFARDPDWGPTVVVGFGGTLTEILADSAVSLLPVSRGEVVAMLRSLKLAPMLEGYRGSTPADLEALADAIVAIADAALALGPDLAALEVNPLRVAGAQIEALDGLAIYASH